MDRKDVEEGAVVACWVWGCNAGWTTGLAIVNVMAWDMERRSGIRTDGLRPSRVDAWSSKLVELGTIYVNELWR